MRWAILVIFAQHLEAKPLVRSSSTLVRSDELFVSPGQSMRAPAKSRSISLGPAAATGATAASNNLFAKLRFMSSKDDPVSDDASTETDTQGALADCTNRLYSSISIEVDDAQNLPLPDSPTDMYVAFKWYEEDVETITGTDNVTVTEASARTTAQRVTAPRREASWEDDGFYTFPYVCGVSCLTI
jgi:hypothetical protein